MANATSVLPECHMFLKMLLDSLGIVWLESAVFPHGNIPKVVVFFAAENNKRQWSTNRNTHAKLENSLPPPHFLSTTGI